MSSSIVNMLYSSISSIVTWNCKLDDLTSQYCTSQHYHSTTIFSFVSTPSRTGLAALELPEQPTVSSASDFFVNYITLVSSVEPIGEVITRKGRSLVQYILQAIAWAAPRSYLKSFTNILAALRTHCVTLTSQWLEVCVCVCVHTHTCTHTQR